MYLLIAMCVYIMVPFAILWMLGYKKGLEVGVTLLMVIAVYLLSFVAGLFITALFENGQYWRSYEQIMPKFATERYLSSLKYGDPLIWYLGAPAFMVYDFFAISLHFIFTHSKITMWLPLLLGAYIIKTIWVINFDYLFGKEVAFSVKNDQPKYNDFGRRIITPQEEEQEISDNIMRIKSEKPMK